MKSYSLRVEGTQVLVQLADVPMPEAGPGQLLLKMHAAGLNRGEFIPGGLIKGGAAKPAGIEGSGEIVALGAGVTGLTIGQRVMGRCPGAFSEFAVMDAREALPVPAGLAMEAAAAVPLTLLVVHDMLVLQGRLQSGEWLLVTGVSSGVGVASLQAAKALGAKVIGTSGSPEKLARLQALGLDVAINTRSPDFAAQVLEATGGQGVNLVVNTVGGSVFAECLRCMAFEGRLATVGYVDHQLKAEIDIQALHVKRLTLFGVSNKMRSADQRAAGLPAFKVDLLPAIADGRIRPLVDRVFPFDELAAAQAHMETNQHLGKIVLKISD
ncbi:zinc-binding dehydrogenase [Roseateles toxinivorans]|uniref:NADPH:quinone reductase-like Zn-dependent oxidoreductase n=1 Tax=Roseateles toxinivorans TaxID=270368 RepID=A0A4R6QSN4_9BURK|nr:zinc-binding dehydrogenase [Roseateles toxinivorans]TDP74351.1 NADPH:quinone reductase-like Zn-dependent oxidoreductase [Roseateles toxinivorans]